MLNYGCYVSKARILLVAAYLFCLMENAINTLRIQNFKPIKDATMNPRRVNLIIGQPNVAG